MRESEGVEGVEERNRGTAECNAAHFGRQSLELLALPRPWSGSPGRRIVRYPFGASTAYRLAQQTRRNLAGRCTMRVCSGRDGRATVWLADQLESCLGDRPIVSTFEQRRKKVEAAGEIDDASEGNRGLPARSVAQARV